MAIPKSFSEHTATIANAGTTSGAVQINPRGVTNTLKGIITPAALTGTAFTFSASNDGTNFYGLKSADGSDVSITVTTSKFYVLDPADFAGVGWLKVISNAAEGGARSITLLIGRA